MRKKALVFRVAEVGSLSLGAKMAMQIFVKRVFMIFATNASFLRVLANLTLNIAKGTTDPRVEFILAK